jgi:D-psicose/D-tagatose/L-ribulose 3-epimerase
LDVLIGCHGLVWTGAFDAPGIELAVRKTAAAGFDLIEFPLLDPYAFDVDAARKSLQDNGIACTASLGLSPETDVSSADSAVVAAGEALLGRCLEVLSDIGGTHLCGVIYSAMTKYQRVATDAERQNSVEALRRLAARGAELGVRLSCEVVNRYETNLLNTGRQALAFIDDVGHDNVSVHLDTYHMNIEESDMAAPVLDCGDRLGYVHIGESHRGYLGSGSVDFDTFFRALARVGYDGPVVFESFSSAVVNEELTRMLGIWRNLWSDSEDLGSHANAFIRGQLTAVASIGMQ